VDGRVGAPQELVAPLVAVSRTLGADPSLVMHGGGNTSLKVRWRERTGRETAALLVKGSGCDLATIGEDGFAPLRLERVRELLPPTQLGDLDLVNELRCSLLDASAPDPSVETLVHALLPHPAVVHSHADVLLTLTNTPDGAAWVSELLGDRVVVVEYAMPGPELGAACAAAWATQAGPDTVGLVVLQHGLFTVGDNPQQALDRHHELLRVATAAVRDRLGRARTAPAAAVTPRPDPVSLARLRAEISELAGTPMIVRQTGGPEFERLLTPAILDAIQRGPVTPDHALWTKPFPMIGTDVRAYGDRYRAYVSANEHRRDVPLMPLDPAPRVALTQEHGLLSIGRTVIEAKRAEDITRHTLAVVADAEELGGYRPASAGHVFDLEYWALQQEKLHRAHDPAPLTGRIALVTGAASGIGRACAESLLAVGAAVIAVDRAEEVVGLVDDPAWLGLQADVTDEAAVRDAIADGVARFGGLDIVVVGAGIFPEAAPLTELSTETWRRTMAVNVDSVAALYRMVGPLLEVSPHGGRVVVVASKNVLAPGPGAAAYSASKAALTQLSRVAALEWAPKGVRVNLVHPDAVFDTGLWTQELLRARAEHYGMSIEDYKRRNLLRTEVTSRAVARLVQAMADETFACTTGAQVPIDGGNERVI
jgi:rhamnose utilization protein RhaD (predicted bifunctional aldolase and dehydrogenase)/NAD(P)-dependent dehydrogenase (short-subunit alcohol dehydrogenase family)